MYLFSKVKDIAYYSDDFHYFYTPIDCRSFRDFYLFLLSTILLILMSISPRRIVYYSSEAVTAEKSLYSTFKKIHEKILRNYDLILRIPHVYSSDRDKGLIKILRDGRFIGDKSIKLEYITDIDFREFFLRNIDKKGVVMYDGVYRKNSVSEIENLFISDVND